jgi:hypothetical protein
MNYLFLIFVIFVIFLILFANIPILERFKIKQQLSNVPKSYNEFNDQLIGRGQYISI